MKVGAALVLVLAVAQAGCGGDDGGSEEGACSVKPLDPKAAHYGKSYDEWMVAWQKWFWQLPQQGTGAQCVVPIQDPSGEQCAAGQDPSSDVFFLVGNFGGVTVRDACSPGADQALFFPVLSYTADNAGVAPADQVDAEGLKAAAAGMFDVATDLHASVDGCEMTDLQSYRLGPTEFSYVVPPEPNLQACLGMSGVEGEIKPAFTAGYWLLLPPLGAGKHEIHFEGRADLTPEDFVLDVTYELDLQ